MCVKVKVYHLEKEICIHTIPIIAIHAARKVNIIANAKIKSHEWNGFISPLY